MKILIQIIGLIALIIWLFSVQKNDKRKILKLQLVSNIFYGLQYLLLGTITVGILSFVSSIKCFAFLRQKDLTKNNSLSSLIFFSSIIILISILTYDGYYTILPCFINLLYTYSNWQKNLTKFRFIYIINSVLWLSFNILVGAYVVTIGNIFELIAGTISIIKNDIKKGL